MSKIDATFETLIFLRGMSARYPTDRPSICIARQDRSPKDTSAAFHAAADRWFEETFGIRYRSAATFVSAGRITAGAYAATADHVMRVIPLGVYSYCWSPAIKDFLFLENEMQRAGDSDVWARLNHAGYRCHGLDEAHASGNEVMLSCERYVAIPNRLLM